LSLRELKLNRQQTLTKIEDDFKKQMQRGEGYEDDRFWRPKTDAVGDSLNTIRFLPAPDGEPSIVRVYRHAFQGPTGKWYIENCLSTLNRKDPVNELNRRACAGLKWEEVPKPVKDKVSARKRKTEYISNILVIDDQINPDNNGKVMLFRYGPQIHGIINEKMFPKYESEERINPFDLWGPDADGVGGGANFKVRVYMKGNAGSAKKFPSYDKSYFTDRKALSDDDQALEQIYSQCYSLLQFTADDQFKSYEELEAKLLDVLGEDTGSSHDDESEYDEVEAPSAKEAKPAWDDADDEINEDFFNDVEQD